MSGKWMQWIRGGQLLLVAVLVPAAFATADDYGSSYSDYWQGELAKATAPLAEKKPAVSGLGAQNQPEQPLASVEKVKKMWRNCKRG